MKGFTEFAAQTQTQKESADGEKSAPVPAHSVFPPSGSNGFKARGKMFEVKSTSGKLLFSADEQEVVVGAERLRVMGE